MTKSPICGILWDRYTADMCRVKTVGGKFNDFRYFERKFEH